MLLRPGRQRAAVAFEHLAPDRPATVPADIRALVDARPGTRLVRSPMPDGTIIVRAKTKSILDMAGMLKAPNGKRVNVDDMNPWR
jgi:bifunctional DNA-binding transcriptional regulator/antitoxin component of YhaV-PrlF toxin-antitoxin module